jgi:methyl-accepting chemotaxis protein
MGGKRLRFLLMSAVLLSAAVGSAAIGFWSNSELSHSISESALLARVLRNQGDADMMHDAVRGDVYRALHAARELPSQRAEVEEQLAKHLAWFQRVTAENKALSLPGHLRNQFSQLDGPLAAYMEAAAQLTALAFTDSVNADRLLPNFVEKFDLLEDAMERVSSAIEAEAGRVEREAGDLARMAG